MVAHNYIEWFDAEEMHQQAKEWFSELSFIKEEQGFLHSLIKSLVFKPMHLNRFEQIKKFKTALSESSDRCNPFIKEVQKHMNGLEILLDASDQLDMEKKYRKSHKAVLKNVNQYITDYQNIKKKGFALLSAILRDDKKLVLGNPEYKLKTTNSKAKS